MLEVPASFNFEDFWDNLSNRVNSTLTILYSIMMLVSLFLFPYIIKKNFLNLKSDHIKQKYGVLYEANKISTMKKALYNIFFLWRRFVTVVVLVFGGTLPFF